MLQEFRRRVEPSLLAIRLELGRAEPLERRRAAWVRELLPFPCFFVKRLQHSRRHVLTPLACLARLAEDLVQDHAVHRLRALHDRQALLLAVPGLAPAIPASVNTGPGDDDFPPPRRAHWFGR